MCGSKTSKYLRSPSGTAAHWGHSKCASWPFAHYVLRARNGIFEMEMREMEMNEMEIFELEMVLAMS